MTAQQLLRLDNTLEHDPAIDNWFVDHSGTFGTLAHRWFEVMRSSGDEVRELLHDGCPVACLGDVPFGYVNIFTAHINVGFFQGATLPDPSGLLQGNGRFMRHVKVRPGADNNATALSLLIKAAYFATKTRIENGLSA